MRKDNTHGFHRHSSSGYVSCSECSYNSGSCSCTSADKCYCSLRTYPIRSKPLGNDEVNLVLSKAKINRDSLISCKTDDKCYCSMADEVNDLVGDFGNNKSDTTCCDTDSCISTSKCYCQHVNDQTESNVAEGNESKPCLGISSARTTAEKLALDYELFTISDNAKPVQPHEALSVKKSVEAAAIFADVKLNQTTDIKSMLPSPLGLTKRFLGGGSNDDESLKKQPTKEHERSSVNCRQNKTNGFILSSQKSHSAGDLLGKLTALKTNTESIKIASNTIPNILAEVKNRQSFRTNYHLMRAGNASLEDSLGYLP